MRLVTIMYNLLLVPVQNNDKKLTLHSNIVNLLTNMPDKCYKQLVTPVQEGQSIPKIVQYEEQNMMAIYELLRFLESRFAEQNVRKVNILKVACFIALWQSLLHFFSAKCI